MLDQSMGGRPHEWIAERAGAAIEKLRDAGYSLIARGGGGGGSNAAAAAAAGGTRGAGVAALAKVVAICGATAAGGATCVATGLVDPGSVGIGSGGEKPALERPAEPTATTVTAPPVEQAVDQTVERFLRRHRSILTSQTTRAARSCSRRAAS